MADGDSTAERDDSGGMKPLPSTQLALPGGLPGDSAADHESRVRAVAAMETFLGIRDGGAVVSLPAGPKGGGSTPPGHLIGGYEILSWLGEGGMGVVYRARQLSLRRLVALKMIQAGRHARTTERARFKAEAEAAAQLQHPNVVQIYEIGEHDGIPFFSLELVEGGSLAEKVDGVPLPPREAARLVRDIALGVQAAHERGLIHRDLKPSNILLTRDGTPKITDFGLAKNLAEQGQTLSGAILGTASYMAPEQASGYSEVTPAADIYALGAVLYELLTGRPPFKGATTVDTLLAVRTKQPIAPSRRQPSVPRELELICLTCMRKDARQRYSSARAVADDLQAFLVGDPIAPPLLTRRQRLAQYCRENPLTVLVVITGICLFAGLLVALLSDSLVSVLCALLGALFGASLSYRRLRATLRESHASHVAAERTVERLHFILERTAQLVATRDSDTLLRLLSDTAVYLVNAQRATVYLIDRERGELWSKVLQDDRLAEIRLPLGVGIAGTVALTGETINVSDAYSDSRFFKDIDTQSGRRTRNLLTLALTGHDGQILGVFQIMNKRVGAFTREDIAMLSWLKQAAVVAIENACREPPTPPQK